VTTTDENPPERVSAWALRVAERLGTRRAQLLDDLATLVELESPSDDVAALNRAADWLERWLAPVGTVTRHRASDGRMHLLVEPPGAGERGALLMCHYDTVWPIGTTAQWPFSHDERWAYGPGTFDMKASIVAARHGLLALRELELPCNARLLLTADEEIGSGTSHELICEQARRACAALVLEPPLEDGALKTARKGQGNARIAIAGRAAHAGIAPEDGVNAIEEAAHLVGAVRAIADALPGTSATVSRIEGGGATNVVPEHAAIAIDLRAWTAADMAELKARLEALQPLHPEARVAVEVTIGSLPLERTPATQALLACAAPAAAALGLELREGRTGGCSEGNLVQPLGVPVLDGLGVRGVGPHTREERIELANLVPQAALIAALAADLD